MVTRACAARQDLDKVTSLPAPTRRTCLVAARALAATVSSVAECAGSVLVSAHLLSVQRLVTAIEVSIFPSYSRAAWFHVALSLEDALDVPLNHLKRVCRSWASSGAVCWGEWVTHQLVVSMHQMLHFTTFTCPTRGVGHMKVIK